MKTDFIRLITLALVCGLFLAAQAAGDTQLKQVIIFGRHSVRSPSVPDDILNTFSLLPFPDFGNAAGHVTTHGAMCETILGGYYRLWLTKEGLLTGNDSADAEFVYFRANAAEVTTKVTAQAFTSGFLPGASVNVNVYPQANDPVFDPVPAGVALLDPQKAIAAVMGRLGGDPQLLASAYAPELALTRSVLFHYPASETPAPTTPAGKTDVTTIPIDVKAGSPIDLGGLRFVGAAIDPFPWSPRMGCWIETWVGAS
jgi:4-phytase/acid phosphatase